jgi:putative heme-binding domain-containing protein
MHNRPDRSLRLSAFRVRHSAIGLLLLLAASPQPLAPRGAAAQDDPFAAGVRTTPWLSPADEQKAFKLPPGFEINLVAAEPDIQKPLNMAFDERGRIWLTNTIEYPYAAPPDRPGQDTIKILEDTDGDGRFEKVTTFADGLNIPMGIYPWKGGCVAFSIPNIWHFEDTDGDGVCDKRTVLYGPFDTSRDTHGMINSLRRGWDGWVYACHGFNNDSRVKGTDGHEIHMQSGNVFRFQLDGSRIEHFTHGQVNPFGMCFDEYFNIFTADCHSKPIYQLLRGGYYPSFGKPHDGLGFVPPMMDHLHGSTAICGLVKYSGDNFPEEYRGDFYSGNVMTSRINRNKPEYHGSTIKAIEQPDFLSTTDPWFRPVDLQIGPDGAMYILDFYNRIIGHYEVPLPHPGRDRTSGRIWRVSYKNNDSKAARKTLSPDLTKLSLNELIGGFGHAQLEYRLRALNEFIDRVAEANKAPGNKDPFAGEPWKKIKDEDLIKMLESGRGPATRPAIRWVEQRTLWPASYDPLFGAGNREVGIHELKAFAEGSGDPFGVKFFEDLSNKDPLVVRAAADAMGRHPMPSQIKSLVAAHGEAAKDDVLLRYGLLRSLSYHIGAIADFAVYRSLKLDDDAEKLLASTCLAVPASISAAILLRYLETHDDNQTAYLQHAARYADVASLPDIVRIGKSKAAANLELQAEIIQSLATGLTQRPVDGPAKLGDAADSLNRRAHAAPLTEWANDVATRLLAENGSDRIPWTAVPIDGLPPSESPWVVTPRASRDGDKESLFFSSLPRGEQRTGIYRSGVFDLPDQLSFWCSGHSGRPPAPLNDCNYIRLRDAATHEILTESRPPRNDTARQITWNLTKHAGKQGFIELVDGDTANAYAWFAVGRFSLDALNPSDAPRKQQLAAEIMGKLKLESLKPQLVNLVTDSKTESSARTEIAKALASFAPEARVTALANVIADPIVPDDLRSKIGQAIASRDDASLNESLREVLKRAPLRLQGTIAETLSGDAAGAAALLAIIEAGHAAPRLLLLPSVSNKLTALKNADLEARAAAITAKLPPADAILDALITDRRRAFAQAKTSTDRGRAVFEKHCIACHQIAGKGALIGPQLDGIGNRGVDRLLEDVLDPNRNVDVAFRTTTLRLADGRVLSGLVRREEGNQIILADNQGKESPIAKSEIDEQQKTALSLMPANVGEIVPASDFADLVAYLLSQRAVPAGK